MTEAQWAVCNNPATMLDFLQNVRKDAPRRALAPRGYGGWPIVHAVFDPYLLRKLRLFACGCCRRIWHRLPEGAYRDAIVLAEQYADGTATRKELNSVRESLSAKLLPFEPATRSKIHQAVMSASATFDDEYVGRLILTALTAAWEIADLTSVPESTWTATSLQNNTYLRAMTPSQYLLEQQLRANLVRDVIPFPFHKIEFDPAWLSWRDETVVYLARTIYEEHRLNELVILADALEEAGCTEASIIDHCRQPGPHLHGCWVVDLILGRE